MNNYIITEYFGYSKPIYKKFKNFKDCEKWIKNNLDNTKNWKVFNGLYSTIIINNMIDLITILTLLTIILLIKIT